MRTRVAFVLLLTGACMLSRTLFSQSVAPVSRIGMFSPVPLWPQNGDTSAFPAQRVFFHPAANEYIVKYSSADGDETILHVPSHRMTQPSVKVTVTQGTTGQYLYTYTVSNGTMGRSAIDSVTLVLEQRTQLTQGEHESWKAIASADRPIGINMSSAGTLRWTSPTGQEIQPGTTGTDFVVTSDLAPGFALMSFRGKSDLPELDPLQISRLPADVQAQLQACKMIGWDTQARMIVAPRFNTAAPIEAIAANFRLGFNTMDRSQLRSPTSGTLIQINNMLEPVVQGASGLDNSALEALKATATDDQRTALEALQLTLNSRKH